MRTAEKNRSYRSWGNALADIEDRLKYLEDEIERIDGELEELTTPSPPKALKSCSGTC